MIGFICAVLLIMLLDLWAYSEKLIQFAKAIRNCHYSISRVSSNFRNHLYHTCQKYSDHSGKFELRNLGQLYDDPDVLGEKLQVVYVNQLWGKTTKVVIATFDYYYEKPYKNKKELVLWLDKDVSQEQSFLDKHVKRPTMDLTLKILKKKLLA